MSDTAIIGYSLESMRKPGRFNDHGRAEYTDAQKHAIRLIDQYLKDGYWHERYALRKRIRDEVGIGAVATETFENNVYHLSGVAVSDGKGWICKPQAWTPETAPDEREVQNELGIDA